MATHPIPPDRDPAEVNPYQPPQARGSLPARHCPNCGAPLEEGTLYASSRIKWSTKRDNFFVRLFLGGYAVGRHRWGFGFRYAARSCPNCRLYILDR
ncbi:MAG: PF20097 family protein [Verrucomicrobiales bacterium]